MRVKALKIKENKGIATILKGAIFALIISLVAILLFAFIIKLTSLSDGLIKPINQIIKVVSILFGCFLGFKKNNTKTLINGILIGILYTILAFVLFSALNGCFELSKTIFIDILFGGIVGAISSVVYNLIHK